MKHDTRQSKPKNNRNLITTFILAALLVLGVILYPGKPDVPEQYELEIIELGSESMRVRSNNEALGVGEIQLVYGEDMIVEDVNGQIIDFIELNVEDRIRVEVAQNRNHDPVVERIILLPDGSDEYV